MLNTDSIKIKTDLRRGPERGISLFLTLIVMSVLLSISLGINVIFWGQTRVLRYMGDSVIAFYAADTGIERALREGSNVSDVLSNGATYDVVKINKGEPGCLSAVDHCMQSVGIYKETKRAIQITR